jgi:hypothetical protein
LTNSPRSSAEAAPWERLAAVLRQTQGTDGDLEESLIF